MGVRTSTAESTCRLDVERDIAPAGPAAAPSPRVRVRGAEKFAMIALFAAFSGYRVWQGFAGPPVIWPDSVDYARSAVWAGTRPPLVPLLLGITPSASWFVGVQVAVAVGAWSALALAIAARVSVRMRFAALVVVLAFGSTTAVVRWDRSVLSESLAMSTLALLLASLVWAFAGATTWPRVVVLLACAGAFAAVRDPDIWVVWLLGAIIGVEAVVSGRGRHGIVVAFGLAACAGVLLGGSLGAARADGNIAHAYFVRVFPYPDRVDWFARHGMPNANEVRAYARDAAPDPDAASVVGIDPHDATVQPLVRWLDDHGTAMYVRWLVEHPTYLVTEPLRQPERAYNFADGDISVYSAPGRTELGFVDDLLFPSAPFIALVGVVAIGTGLASSLRRESWWWLTAAFGGLGALHVLLAWHGDGMETTRHVSVGNVQVRLVIVVLAIASIGAVERGSRSPDINAGSAG